MRFLLIVVTIMALAPLGPLGLVLAIPMVIAIVKYTAKKDQTTTT